MSAGTVKIRSEDYELRINFAHSFGAVTIPGRNVKAEVVAERVAAGDSVDSVVDDFEVTREAVIASCVWFHEHLADCKPPSRRTRFEKRIVAAWSEWAHDAYRMIAGWDKTADAIPDPPEVTP